MARLSYRIIPRSRSALFPFSPQLWSATWTASVIDEALSELSPQQKAKLLVLARRHARRFVLRRMTTFASYRQYELDVLCPEVLLHRDFDALAQYFALSTFGRFGHRLDRRVLTTYVVPVSLQPSK